MQVTVTAEITEENATLHTLRGTTENATRQKLQLDTSYTKKTLLASVFLILFHNIKGFSGATPNLSDSLPSITPELIVL